MQSNDHSDLSSLKRFTEIEGTRTGRVSASATANSNSPKPGQVFVPIVNADCPNNGQTAPICDRAATCDQAEASGCSGD